jgi:hypothetical protein
MDLLEAEQAGAYRHPWELSRAKCITKIIQNRRFVNAADIGAGDRFFTNKLLFLSSGAVYAVDTGYPEQETTIKNITCLKDISRLPKLAENSAIIMMDVLEHVLDDAAFLQIIASKFTQKGYLLITVPAFQFLFSAHDTYLKHHRRYSRKQLVNLLRNNGFLVKESHYFYTALFFLRFFLKPLDSLRKNSQSKELHTINKWPFAEKNFLTSCFELLLNIDFSICRFLAKLHLYLPGLSLLAICSKETSA